MNAEVCYYYLMLRDNKGEFDNVVIVNGWPPEEREAALAALKTLQSVCCSTCTAWIDADILPKDQELEDTIARITGTDP